ncbi:RDD family protein [Candidatus Thiodictyon syntrophicum]|uniref:RDD family protein n=1 Tax=Candidatus Thiodictyon syntrophicum TaxID=1166950 RepID=A0A2K8UFK0_9GAMM|nr:RDD family protein [Candidatus Thiodictyon syntrophicum]AUB84353.1 RDD family protein [Candidatus Thiodictyon syntrophicum]
MPLDTIRLNETPEGVDLGLRVAGPAPRALALAADGAIRLVILLALSPLSALSGLGLGLNLIAVFLLEWLYPVTFEVLYGATPGKRAMGLLVVHDDGTPVGLSASLIRNLLRVVDFFPLFYGVGLVCTLVDRDFRRLGDLAAGTLVVHAQRRSTGARAGRTHAGGTPAPPGLPIATQQAILAFCERARRLSGARRIELAETLLAHLPSPATGPARARGWAAVEQVEGYGTWLASGRAGD